LQRIVDDPAVTLLVARDGDEIVGTTTLIVYSTPFWIKARLDEVVVDAGAREPRHRAQEGRAGRRAAVRTGPGPRGGAPPLQADRLRGPRLRHLPHHSLEATSFSRRVTMSASAANAACTGSGDDMSTPAIASPSSGNIEPALLRNAR